MEGYRIVLLLIMTFSLTAGIIREDVAALTYRQSNGEEVVLKKLPERVIVAHLSLTGLWYSSGGTAVAVPSTSRKSVLPEAARKLPEIGLFSNPNAEQILKLNPDLVILQGKLEKHWALQKLLRQAGVDSVCIDYINYEDFLDVYTLFRKLNGDQRQAVEKAETITAEVNRICEIGKGKKQPEFACVFGSAYGFSLESSRANTAYMLTRLGGRNILGDSTSRIRVKFSMEQLLLADPEVIFILSTGDSGKMQDKFRKDLMARPEWQILAAVKNNRVHILDTEYFLYLPGEKFPDAFRKLAGLLYP